MSNRHARPTAFALAMRDPAMAALLGDIGQSNFGVDGYPGAAPQAASPYPSPFGADGYGFGYDAGFGFGFGADAALAALPPAMHPAATPGMGAPPIMAPPAPMAHHGHHGHHPGLHPHHAALINEKSMRHHHNLQREVMLDPNKHATTKVERYSFPINATNQPLIGTGGAFTGMSNQPDTQIRPQRVITNSPTQGLIFIQDIKVANVSVLVGGGSAEDAFFYGPGAFGVHLDMPTLLPSNKATVTAYMTALVPTIFNPGDAFQFCVSLQGPSLMAGGPGGC
jgi:hypothetical protein